MKRSLCLLVFRPSTPRAVTYECEYCGSRYPAEYRVCERCGAARLRPVPPAPPTPPRKRREDTVDRSGKALAVVACVVLVAWYGSFTRRAPIGADGWPEREYCRGSPHAPRKEARAPAPLRYTTRGVEPRARPEADAPPLARLPPGGEVRASGAGAWLRATTAGGAPLGYLPAASLRAEPPTTDELRRLSAADRAALERVLLAGLERRRNATTTRLRPAAAPDWRRLGAVPADSMRTQDTAWTHPAARPPFALFAEVEERGDAAHLVLVAGEALDRTMWDAVTFLPHPPPRDSAWFRGRHTLEVTGPLMGKWLGPRIKAVVFSPDSAQRATAWRAASADSVEMRFAGGACTLAYIVPEPEKERLRQVLRLYDLKRSHRDTEARR